MKINFFSLAVIVPMLLLLGIGCQKKTPSFPDVNSYDFSTQATTSKQKSVAEDVVNTDIEKSNPSVDNEQTQNQAQEGINGQAQVKIINKISRMPVPGHLIHCTGCTNGIVLESDINGDITLNFTKGDAVYFSAERLDWHNYDSIDNIKPNDVIVVETNPQGVRENNGIFFPKVDYVKNPTGKMQLEITYKDRTGFPKVQNLNLTGPIEDGVRKTAFGDTDSNGKAIIDLPTSGAYRLLIGTDFFQFDVPTGYNVRFTLDYSRLNEMISGTQILSKNFRESGMILVCVREKTTNIPVSTTVIVPLA